MRWRALPCVLVLAACDMSSLSVPGWAGGSAPIKKIEGERVAILPGPAMLAEDPSLAGVPLSLPAPAAHDAWPQHSANYTADTAHIALAESLENESHATAGDGEDFAYRLAPAPIVADHKVFAMDANGLISAHAADNVRDVLWVSPGVGTPDDDPVMGGGMAYSEGRVFAASGKGLVVALDAATGAEVWRYMVGIPVRSSPRVEGGRVYIVTVDSQLFALDAARGSVLWSHRGVNEGTGLLIEATPSAAGGVVVAPYASGEIVALHADDGSPIWGDGVLGPQRQSATAVFTGIGGDPVIEDGMLYVPGSAGEFAVFQLATGRRLWEQPISSIDTPWVAGDTVYVLTSDSTVIAFHRMDGRVHWVRPLPAYANEAEKKEPLIWRGPVLAGGRLLIIGEHGVLLSLSPVDGKIVGTEDIPNHAITPPVVAGGAVYFITADATLHAWR